MNREIRGCAAMNRVKPGCAWWRGAGFATFVNRLGVCCINSEPVIFPTWVVADHPQDRRSSPTRRECFEPHIQREAARLRDTR